MTKEIYCFLVFAQFFINIFDLGLALPIYLIKKTCLVLNLYHHMLVHGTLERSMVVRYHT